jgi:hypothetical protein
MNKKYWPGRARVIVAPKDHDAVVDWLRQNIDGIYNDVCIISRGDHVRDYYFRSGELATLFALRWS